MEVALEGELPPIAKPGASVDGTMQLEQLQNVVYVGRPVFGRAQSAAQIFKLEPDGKTATRVQVKLGAGFR